MLEFRITFIYCLTLYNFFLFTVPFNGFILRKIPMNYLRVTKELAHWAREVGVKKKRYTVLEEGAQSMFGH